MPTVIGHHDVKDTAHWLASPKREEVFGPLGVTNIRTFVNPQNRTQVAVLMDIADLDIVMAAMRRLLNVAKIDLSRRNRRAAVALEISRCKLHAAREISERADGKRE